MSLSGLCHSEFCPVGGFVAFGIQSFGIVSFAFMSLGIMSFGILSVYVLNPLKAEGYANLHVWNCPALN